MSNKNKTILICNGSYKVFHDDSKLICGGCGYVYSPDEAAANVVRRRDRIYAIFIRLQG